MHSVECKDKCLCKIGIRSGREVGQVASATSIALVKVLIAATLMRSPVVFQETLLIKGGDGDGPYP